ncbi:IclR family transcriptional regulator [Pseudonocardia humida]|uniref:IclR family transcriptional regulator n=1 Tax=Pseudonocardia humida TaxID=2800819 RepID=A0ABT0ZXM2_9PSEU|nr:IclR family transcriptional regulator [Pseudonocardia humida]MCO1655495.1 IclR family transcriptional regulator [Pseudonocardia humida]
MTTASPAPASMIDRIVTILDSFDGPHGFTLAQVVARTGLPRSSAHRILEHLVKVGWLRRDQLHYHLGLRILELGTLACYQHQLRGAASPHLYELAHSTGMTVHLAVLDGPEIVYLDKLGGRSSLRVPSRIGGRAPATCTGVGKVLLAYAEEAGLEAVLGRPLPRPTPASIGTERRLRAELAHVRDRGIAFDREESAWGLGCVAAPIGPPGSPEAALSVCGPIARVNLEHLVGPVRASAQAVWASVGAGRTAPPSSLHGAPAPRQPIGA